MDRRKRRSAWGEAVSTFPETLSDRNLIAPVSFYINII
jgi:hypothetical protein